MKKLLSLLALSAALFIPAQKASAQEVYSVSVNLAANVTVIDQDRVFFNKDTCNQRGLADNCTQGEVCVAVGAVGGLSCNVSQATAAGVRLFTANPAGREAFISIEWIKAKIAETKVRSGSTYFQTLRTWCQTATPTQKDLACTNSGSSAGCGICDGQ